MIRIVVLWLVSLWGAVGVDAAELVGLTIITDQMLCLEIREGRVKHETLGSGRNGKIFREPLDLKKALAAETYKVKIEGKGELIPLNVHRKSKGMDYARVDDWEIDYVLTHWIYLELPSALTPRKNLVLHSSQLFDAQPFTYGPLRSRSEAIQVNQAGYAPAAEGKFAYLSHWMGSGEGLNVSRFIGRPFHVVDLVGGEVAFAGKMGFHHRKNQPDDAYDNSFTKADILQADFSALKKPGDYIVSIEGVGRSFPFQISEDIYSKPYKSVMSALYHQRCGCSLDPDLTAWPRDRCHHPDDRKILQSTHRISDGSNAFEDLPKHSTGEAVAYWGGYHDAGDWDRGYIHLGISDALLMVYEMESAAFADGELAIPEKANGVADIVDEARWTYDLFARMQKPRGGVCGGLESTEHPKFGETSAQDTLALYAYAPDPAASYAFAATACRMHRVAKEGDALSRAERAWQWAERQENAAVRFKDLRAYAAAELFRSTEKETYHAAFKESLAVQDAYATLVDYGKYDQRWAAWSYVLTTHDKVDPGLQKRLRKAVIHFAQSEIIETAQKRARRNGYNWWKPYGHGSATVPANLPLIVVHHLTGNDFVLQQMHLNCDSLLGNNPLNIPVGLPELVIGR